MPPALPQVAERFQNEMRCFYGLHLSTRLGYALSVWLRPPCERMVGKPGSYHRTRVKGGSETSRSSSLSNHFELFRGQFVRKSLPFNKARSKIGCSENLPPCLPNCKRDRLLACSCEKIRIHKDGKEHGYWSLVETLRTADGPPTAHALLSR